MRYATLALAFCAAISALPTPTTVKDVYVPVHDAVGNLKPRDENPVHTDPTADANGSHQGILYDIILDIRHIRHTLVLDVEDTLKDVDPVLGQQVTEVVNKLNRFERALFIDLGLPGTIYHKISLEVHELGNIVQDVEKVLLGVTGVLDPLFSSLLGQVLSIVDSIGADIMGNVEL